MAKQRPIPEVAPVISAFGFCVTHLNVDRFGF
jgi:hypothetical protein